MVCSWPTLLGMVTEGIVWITWRICWPPAPCVAKMDPGERTWREKKRWKWVVVTLLRFTLLNPQKVGVYSYHGAYRLHRRGDRCGWQAGLGHSAAGSWVDCGARCRSGARFVERKVNGLSLVLSGARMRRGGLCLALLLHLQVFRLWAVITYICLLERTRWTRRYKKRLERKGQSDNSASAN